MKIICEKCESSFKYELIKDMKCCPVCGEKFDMDSDSNDEHSDWITWYYYGHKRDNGKTASLRDKPIDLEEHGDTFFLIQEFKAPPETAPGGLDEVKRILRTYVPDAFPPPKEPIIRCPWCNSKEYTLLNRGYSLLTGFLGSGKPRRICNYCKREF